MVVARMILDRMVPGCGGVPARVGESGAPKTITLPRRDRRGQSGTVSPPSSAGGRFGHSAIVGADRGLAGRERGGYSRSEAPIPWSSTPRGGTDLEAGDHVLRTVKLPSTGHRSGGRDPEGTGRRGQIQSGCGRGAGRDAGRPAHLLEETGRPLARGERAAGEDPDRLSRS